MPNENGASGVKSEVEAALNGGGGESSTPETPESVAPQGVKAEETPAQPVKQVENQPVEPAKAQEKPVSVEELKAQVDNLNIAIKKEREEGKVKSETLAKKLEESTTMLERLKSAFNPEPLAPDPITPPMEFLTPRQAEEIWEQKEQERLRQTAEQNQAAAIQAEIKNLETEWNGKDGRPLYDDAKVLQWQKDNEKLYLSPSEAFQAMARSEIVDWEVKKVLSGKKTVENVETPSTTPGQHEPAANLPKTEAETRNAIMEAINNAEAEI